ncbi:MAG: hypothetical protein M0Z50_18290 [Planctomycetia bacterium]|nr:hypothetical protein [Planctomycetia bacterium]
MNNDPSANAWFAGRREFIKAVAGAAVLPALAGQDSDDAEMVRTPFYQIAVSRHAPVFRHFCVDSLGTGKVTARLLLPESPVSGIVYQMTRRAGRIAYRARGQSLHSPALWQLEFHRKAIRIRSRYARGLVPQPMVLNFNQLANHATLLGRMESQQLAPLSIIPANGAPASRARSPQVMLLPCIMHLPDLGSVRITGGHAATGLGYDALRSGFGGTATRPYVKISFPPADARHPVVDYTLEVVAIYPAIKGIAANPLYDGFRRNFLNIFQINPRLRVLANNSSSDPCAFTLYLYAEMAAHSPRLAPGLTCLDMVRWSLERYISGMKGYGEVGYTDAWEGTDKPGWNSPHDSLDSRPSLLIAAGIYIIAADDFVWGRKHYSQLLIWMRKMLATDTNGNGLIKYFFSGDAGAFTRYRSPPRPANWWDTIGFGHEDAYSNALAYRACTLMARVAKKLGKTADADNFSRHAMKIKQSYAVTFLNPKTGLLGGWRDARGHLHDYCFTFVQGVAVTYGLLDLPDAHAVMSALLKKMQAVGYTMFQFGMPGNLIPIRRDDYLPTARRWGYPSQANGDDTFQIYENGGATAAFTYFTIKALYRLGRPQDARKILYPMLRSFAHGDFQGVGKDGMTKDWKSWTGKCWGYEGFLVDGYLALLAVLDDVK